MRNGLVVMTAGARDARSAARPADFAGARCKLPGQAPGLAAEGSGDTMNVFTARDLEAADLLALAQLDDNGAPCLSGPPRSQLGRPDPANDRGDAGAADLHLLLTYRPEGSGEHTAGGSAGLHPAVPGGAPG